MFKSIKRANKKITELELEISSLKSKLHQNENNVSVQDFVDMRLRAQKAEIALEAIIQSNRDRSIAENTKRFKFLEEIKNLVSKY